MIFYDISSDKLRSKVSKMLIERGYERLQYSVFAGPFHPDKFGLWTKLEKLMNEYTDEKLYCIKLSTDNFKNMKIIGYCNQDFDYICGTKNSLVI